MLVESQPDVHLKDQKAGSKINQVNNYWAKVETQINPFKLTYQDKTYLDFAFDSIDQFKEDKKYLQLLELHKKNTKDLNEAYLQELYEIYKEFHLEKSQWIKPLSHYLIESIQKPGVEQEKLEQYKKIVKKIKYSIQSNLLITHQSFNSHIPKGHFVKPISLEELSEYYEQCIYFDGEFSWDREAIIVPGDMRAFSFQDDDQIKTIYVFARYGSSPRKQIVEAMSHYHALNSFKYTEHINQQIRSQFNNRQDFKKYFAYHYNKALKLYKDIEKLDQRDLDFCREFIFPRPVKLFLPRKYDSLSPEKLRNAIDLNVVKNRHHALNASIMFNLGDSKQAEQYLEKHLRRNPKSISLGRHLAFIKILKGNKRDGVNLLSKYLSQKQNDYNLVSYQLRSLIQPGT